MIALIGIFFGGVALFLAAILTIANLHFIREHSRALLTAGLVLGGLAGAAYLGAVSAACGGVP